MQVICAVLVLVLLMFKDEDRSLNSVQEIASDPDMLKAAANKLRELGGIPARLGNQLKTLFDKEVVGLTKEGAGVLSTVSRHLSFLDSELVAKCGCDQYVRSGGTAKARHHAVLADTAGPAGGAEGVASLLDFHPDPGNRCCR